MHLCFEMRPAGQKPQLATGWLWELRQLPATSDSPFTCKMGSARTPKCSQSSLGSRSPSSNAKGTCSHARSQWPLPEDPTSSCPCNGNVPPDGNHRGTQPDSQDDVGESFSGPRDPENKDSHFSVRYSAPSSSLPSRTRVQACTWLQLWKTATHTQKGFPSQIPLSPSPPALGLTVTDLGVRWQLRG